MAQINPLKIEDFLENLAYNTGLRVGARDLKDISLLAAKALEDASAPLEQDYLVQWSCDIQATSPEEAVKIALEWIKEGKAPFFEVTDEGGDTHSVYAGEL